jgi:probable F420-dependent oxidoreductase
VPVAIAAQIQPQHADYEGMRRAWVEAEELGVDTIWNWDHFFPLSGDPVGKHYECLTMLAAMAEATERVRIGSLVCCNSYRNPELLADMHRTIDHISGGRVILGIGAGWFEKDYIEYGYEFGTAPDRLRELRRALPRIRSRLARLNPPPLGPMPMLIGGAGEKVTLRLVADHAQMWHSGGSLETYHHKNGVLEDWCAKVGRDPREIERMWSVEAGLVERQAEPLVEAGVTHLHIAVGGDGKGYDLAPVRELVEWRDARR